MAVRTPSGPARVTAEAANSEGGLYIGAPLTPYDVEALCEQLAHGGDLRVVVGLAAEARNAPELRSLRTRLARLQRRGVAVSVHAARGKLTPRG